MAGFAEMLQRIARNLEESGPQQPGDDLRARLGYGSGDDAEDVDDGTGDVDATDDPEPTSIWGPQPARTPDVVRAPADAGPPALLRPPEAPRAPSRTMLRAHEAPPPPSPSVPPGPHASSESLLSERVRARLRTPDALREAFVTKELLDRPLGLRRTR